MRIVKIPKGKFSAIEVRMYMKVFDRGANTVFIGEGNFAKLRLNR